MAEQFYSPILDPANIGAQRLWGHYVGMLVHGGGWQGSQQGVDVLHKPRSVAYYEDETITEPDQRISNKVTTNKIIVSMVGKHWSLLQCRAALLDPVNIGGAYARWRTATDKETSEDYIEVMYLGSYTAEQQAQHNRERVSAGHPSNTYTGDRIRGVTRNQWQVLDNGIVLDRRKAEDILQWLSLVGAATGGELRQSGRVHPRMIKTYMTALEDAGLVVTTSEKHLCANGRMQPSRVSRTASEETVRLHLTADNLPEADRALWECLWPSETLVQNTLTFEEVMRL